MVGRRGRGGSNKIKEKMSGNQVMLPELYVELEGHELHGTQQHVVGGKPGARQKQLRVGPQQDV